MMVDSALVSILKPSSTDRYDATETLLGVRPKDIARLETVHETTDMMEDEEVVVARRPRSGSVGLDELAALAATMDSGSSSRASYSAMSSPSSSSDEDSIAMPPPPRRRPRSASNPEGMEKWDSFSSNRSHFILPSAILEEELAEASALAKVHEEERSNSSYCSSLPLKKRGRSMEDPYGRSPDSVTSPIMSATKADSSPDESSEEANATPDELLRKSRSRLLEDLSEGSLKGEKGVLTLPHALAKYKEVYNKNGRIGIYSPTERAAIIARFHNKRSRRVWNKKIRYGCRKNLADRRLRVKGRFVKRASTTTKSPSIVVEENCPQVVDTPDVNDPEAGFCPTSEQPFRRVRRHTIT